MGCMPSKNAHVKIATPNAKIVPHNHEDKLSSAKAHILDSIKRRDPILFEKTMHAHQVRPTEVLGQADQKRTILHFIAEANFSQGMTLALDYILHHQQNQVEQAVNIKDSDGNTPAIICCLQDAGNTLEVLLKSGHLNLNAKNNSGQTALTIAADRDGACQKILNSQPVTREATTRSVIPSSQISQSPETPKIPLSDEIAATQPGPRGSMKLRSVQSLKKESKISPDTRLYQVLNDLVASNKEFVDEEFPHDNESIVPEEMQSQYLKDYGTVKWLRPHEFLGCDVTAVSLFEGIDINHVNESPLAGCDLYSAFAAMLEFPQRLLKIFTTIESNKQGAYSVKFLVSGIPVEILLDDYFPCSMNSKPLFSRPANIELWFSLLEKAFAKLYGSFSELNSISISEAFQTMTGMPSSQHAIKEVTDDELWNQLLEYDKRNYIFCAGNNKTANDKKNRIFTVARLYEVDNYRILKLKNHFEDFVWKGDFSDGSELWTKELKAEVGHYAGEKNYFYMEIKEFMKQFEFVATCHYNESLIRNSQETTCNHKKPVFFEIEVDREMEVFISVHQKLARFVDDEGYEVSPVEILVAEDLDDGILRKVSYGEKDAFIGKPTVFADDKIRTKLSEGRYVIRVKIRWVDEQKHDFTLNVFSPHPLSFKKVKSRHYPDFLERVYLDAGSRSSERYQLGNRCEFGSSWCGPHLWLFGMNKGTKTWNLEINFNKIENLRLCKKYRTEENILKLEIPPKGQAVAFAKRINSKTVELNWNFNQSWS